MAKHTQLLNSRQFRGLERLGDIYLPGDQDLPSFSACGCTEHADQILSQLPDGDRKDLQSLLALLGTLPRILVALFVRLIEAGDRFPGSLGNSLRFAQMGIKGLVLTLYYSGLTGADYRGPSSLDVLDYHVGVYTADVDDLAKSPTT
jgi:hypothetical protein